MNSGIKTLKQKCRSLWLADSALLAGFLILAGLAFTLDFFSGGSQQKNPPAMDIRKDTLQAAPAANCSFYSLDRFGNAKSAIRLNPGLQLQHSRTLGRPVQLAQGIRVQSVQTVLVCLFLAVCAFLKQCRFYACRIREQVFIFQSYLRNSLPVRAGPHCA